MKLLIICGAFMIGFIIIYASSTSVKGFRYGGDEWSID